MKKLNINVVDNENGFQVFGINTALKDYQLCILINDFFNLETRLLSTSSFECNYSVFGDVVDEMKVILVQNVCNDKIHVFPKLKSFEFLVLVTNKEEAVAEIIKSFELNDEILYITKVENKHLSSKENTSFNQLLTLL